MYLPWIILLVSRINGDKLREPEKKQKEMNKVMLLMLICFQFVQQSVARFMLKERIMSADSLRQLLLEPDMAIMQLFWDLEHRLEDINDLFVQHEVSFRFFFNCPEDLCLCSIALGIIDEMAIAGSQEARMPAKVVR